MKYKKLPVVIDAVQWRGGNLTEIRNALIDPDKLQSNQWRNHGGILQIPTLEGVMEAQIGDWIIRGVKGEFYPCKDEIFRMTYEPVDVPAYHSSKRICDKEGAHGSNPTSVLAVLVVVGMCFGCSSMPPLPTNETWQPQDFSHMSSKPDYHKLNCPEPIAWRGESETE